MPDRVHAAVHRMQPPAPDSVLDCAGAQPARVQLLHGHRAALRGGERGGALIATSAEKGLTVAHVSAQVCARGPRWAGSGAVVASLTQRRGSLQRMTSRIGAACAVVVAGAGAGAVGGPRA